MLALSIIYTGPSHNMVRMIMTVNANMVSPIEQGGAPIGSTSAALAACWAELEASQPAPRWMRQIVKMPYDEFAATVTKADAAGAQQIIKSLYAGDVYIIKATFPVEFCRNMIETVYEFGKRTPASFHKMFDGCPNFHRIIDRGVTTNYSVTAVRHGYYFFRWNGNPLGLFEPITARWRHFKTLSGLRPDSFEANIPSDGVVDRLMFYLYPKGGGQLKTHVDPINNHKIIIGGLLSTRGIDFQSGGIYFLTSKDTVTDIEDHVQIGDFVIAYPTVHHGVSPIDISEPIDWETVDGRWFIGLGSVDSDHVAQRVTASRIE